MHGQPQHSCSNKLKRLICYHTATSCNIAMPATAASIPLDSAATDVLFIMLESVAPPPISLQKNVPSSTYVRYNRAVACDVTAHCADCCAWQKQHGSCGRSDTLYRILIASRKRYKQKLSSFEGIDPNVMLKKNQLSQSDEFPDFRYLIIYLQP